MLWIIWLIFALLFLALACFHWKASKQIIPPFKMSRRPLMHPDSPVRVQVGIAGADIDKPLEDFVRDFNSFIDTNNKSSHRQNRIQACGYLLASLMAIFSIFLSI
jgi:hypothetical protein